MIDGDVPNLGPYVLPGNNYHVYDYALFWGSIRADAERRLAAWRRDDHRQRRRFRRRPARPGGRLAGLDVGTKTIGLATCDAGWSFATPAETIKRTKFTADLEALKAFIARHGIVGLVVGLPLNLDGSDSPRTQSVRAFARNLAPLDLPDPAVGRALVDRRGRAGDDRGRHEPRQARREGRRPCRRAYPAGRDRRAGQFAAVER